MIVPPFVLQRIPISQVKVTNLDKKACYYCDKKIKIEKGYYEFHRSYDDYTDPKLFACHRPNCHNKFVMNQYAFKYKDIYQHTEAYYF